MKSERQTPSLTVPRARREPTAFSARDMFRAMKSDNPDVIHGYDTRPLKLEGALVYPLDQYLDIQQTQFPEGLCFGLVSSLNRRLSAGKYEVVSEYQNPLPVPVLEDAIELTRSAIDRIKDGKDPRKIPFNDRRTQTVTTDIASLSPFLGGKLQSTVVEYSMRNGDKHMLLFHKKAGVEPSEGECVVEEPNRFTIDRLAQSSGKKVIKDILARSAPKEVVVTFDTYKMRCSL